jgi:PTH1 family peptidyl-tRNA hydrolase
MNTQTIFITKPRVIIGLGNPGPKHYYQRHNIGFRIVDALAKKYNGDWQKKNNAETSQIIINNFPILLVKPQTFMNNSGECIPWITKQGIKTEEILVIHDELELPFGRLKIRTTGSAKGHNGLKSIIQYTGPNFSRLSVGISRPQNREEVPNYVLSNFDKEEDVAKIIEDSLLTIESLY